MRILLCHNYYQQPGGEDQVFDDEAQLLQSNGHDVIRFTRHNDDIRDLPSWRVAAGTVWSRKSSRALERLLGAERPAIVHFTNTFPLISPSAYYAAQQYGAKVVQSLHNYRLLCPNAYLMREEKVCEECLGKRIAWPAIVHRCYRNSTAGSAVIASMLAFHRMLRTYSRTVDLYFALTEFGRRKFIEGGLPADKIAVKPNFMSVDPQAGDGSRGDALFVGRLSAEKGVETLLRTWTEHQPTIPLTIIGDGPLGERVRDAAARNPQIRWIGRQPSSEVLERLGSARCLVFPSVWYEGLPKTIVESFAKGTPVIASNLGVMSELIADGQTGILFEPSNPASLSRAVNQLIQDAGQSRRMRQRARVEFEQKYTASANYELLISLYKRVLGKSDTSGEQKVHSNGVRESALLSASNSV